LTAANFVVASWSTLVDGVKKIPTGKAIGQKMYSICGKDAMTRKILTGVEFEALSEEARLDLLHRDGVYIGKRNCDGQVLILFQLYGFYVEVHYKNYRRDISHLLVSGDVNMLQPYLDQIHVSGLNSKKK
jgi:hypothetical protein